MISERTTLNAYEVEFVLSVLQEVVIENLEIGRGIELGRLGCLEPSLKAEAVDNKNDINLNTIKKTRLIYKPSKAIKAALKNMKYGINRQRDNKS
jgi:predicted histone-like DNA-binding protein